MLTEQQRITRQSGLGGSDIAALFGLSPWITAYELWLEKTGKISSSYDVDNPVIEAGNRLEPLIARWYEDVSGNKVHEITETLRHPDHPYLLAHIDRKVKGQSKILEIKFAMEFSRKKWGEAGTDQIPLHYICQVQHYLAVTGNQEADVAVLFGGWDLKIYHIKRDEKLISGIIAAAGRFWKENVLAGIAPAPVTQEDVMKMFPQDNGEYLPLSPEIEAKVSDLKALKKKLNFFEKDKKQYEQDIKKWLGENQGAINDNGEIVVTWKSSERTRLDEKQMKQEHPALWQQYAKTNISRTFRT
ncbi:hypothetical protein COB55_05410 [Candidatus Wolfebacteria bacterium]|nr:MAG: hypothetical protein COB55_05410 [Candidatus Wolfebacteria bacterium]